MNEIKEILVQMNQHDVGRIALTSDLLCAFEYSSDWLANGFSISPFYLPLKKEVFVAKRDPFSERKRDSNERRFARCCS